MISYEVGSKCFGNLLTNEFVKTSIPNLSEINPKIEEVKGKAAELSLALFNPGKNDVDFGNGVTFGTFFSQNKYGNGFTKGLAGILAYQIFLEESSDQDLKNFADRVQEASENLFKRINSGDQKLSDARQTLERLDNFGGYYERTYLSNTSLNEIALHGIVTGKMVIDPTTRHLVVQVSPELSEKLLKAYRDEINVHLTIDGKKNLSLPDNIGFIVVAYSDELAKLPQETINLLLGKEVSCTLKTPYVVPVRGDNRYALVASIIIDSQDISTIRNQLLLKELYSEGRPMRYTFGAVHNMPMMGDGNSTLIQRLKNSKSIEPWMQLIK